MAASELATGGEGAAEALSASAYSRLYPEQFLESFLSRDVRSDGRPLGRARALTLVPDTVANAEGSCLARTGRTSVLGGVKLLVSPPNRAAPSLGLLRLTLDLPQASDATARPGKQSEEALELSHRLSVVLASSAALDLSQLCLIPGRLVWCVAVELVCLSRDGSLFDTALAAALGALARTSLPPVSLTPDGRVADTASLSESCGGSVLPNAPLGRLRLRSLPAALTCALYRMGDSHRVLCDPSAEEEELAHALVTVAVDEQGRLLEVHKPGSQPGKGARGDCSVQTLLQCCAAATMRRADVAKVFTSAGIEAAAAEETTPMLS